MQVMEYWKILELLPKG